MTTEIRINNIEPGLGHKLRSPLNAIIGFTGTLLMKLAGPLTPDQERQLKTVQTSAKELLAVINDLTAAEGSQDATSCEKRAVARNLQAQARVLVVDDSAVNLYLMKSTLEPFGYQVITASSAAEALDLAITQSPDLIVSDVNMRGGSGFEFLENVKNHSELCRVPFLFITSTFWNADYRRRGLASGATGWILRPIDPQFLIREIEGALKGKKEN